MATAPRPGTTRNEPDREFTFMFRGNKVAFRPGDLSPKDDLVAYRETKDVLPEPTSIMAAIQRLDSGSIWMFDLALIVWIALLKQGETTESFAEFIDSVTMGELEGLDMEVTESEDDADPLPSDGD